MSLTPLQIGMQNQQIMCQILCDLLDLEHMNKLQSTIDNNSNTDEQTLTDIKNFNQIVKGTFDMFSSPSYKFYGNPQTEDGGYKNYILSVIETYMYFNKMQAMPEETLMLMVYYVYNYLLLKKDVTKPKNQDNINLMEKNIIACKNNTSSMVEPPVSKLLGDFLEKSANIKPFGKKVLPIYSINEKSFGDDFGIFEENRKKILFSQEQKIELAKLITQHDTVNVSLFLAILSGYDMYPDDTKMVIENSKEEEDSQASQDEDSQSTMNSDPFEHQAPFEQKLKILVEDFRPLKTDISAYDESTKDDDVLKQYRDLKFLLTSCFDPITNTSGQVIGTSYSFDITPPPAVDIPFPMLEDITKSVKNFEENHHQLDSVTDIPLYFICQVGESASHIVTILYIEQKVYSFGYGFLGLSDRQQKEQKIAHIFERVKELHTGSGSIYTADFLLQLGKGYKYPLIDFGILTSEHVRNINNFLNKTDTLHVDFELVFEAKADFDKFSGMATNNLNYTGNCFTTQQKPPIVAPIVDFDLVDHVLNYATVDHRTMLRGKDFPTYFEVCQQVSGISEKTKNYNCTSFVSAIFEHITCSTWFFGVVHPKSCQNKYIPSEDDMLKWFKEFSIYYNIYDANKAYKNVLQLLKKKQNIDKGNVSRSSIVDIYSGFEGPMPDNVRKIDENGNKNEPNKKPRWYGGKTKNRQQKTRKTKNRKTRKIKRRVTKKKNQKKYSKNKTKKNRK